MQSHNHHTVVNKTSHRSVINKMNHLSVINKMNHLSVINKTNHLSVVNKMNHCSGSAFHKMNHHSIITAVSVSSSKWIITVSSTKWIITVSSLQCQCPQQNKSSQCHQQNESSQCRQQMNHWRIVNKMNHHIHHCSVSIVKTKWIITVLSLQCQCRQQNESLLPNPLPHPPKKPKRWGEGEKAEKKKHKRIGSRRSLTPLTLSNWASDQERERAAAVRDKMVDSIWRRTSLVRRCRIGLKGVLNLGGTGGGNAETQKQNKTAILSSSLKMIWGWSNMTKLTFLSIL